MRRPLSHGSMIPWVSCTHTHTHNSHHRTSRPMGQLHTHTHKQQPPQNPWAHGSAAYTQTLTTTTTEPVGPWVSCTHTHNSHHRTSVGPWVSRTPTHTQQPPQNQRGPMGQLHTHTTTTEPSWAHGSAAHTLTQQPPQNPWAHGSAAHTHTHNSHHRTILGPWVSCTSKWSCALLCWCADT
jgi:hypothetical protein